MIRAQKIKKMGIAATRTERGKLLSGSVNWVKFIEAKKFSTVYTALFFQPVSETPEQQTKPASILVTYLKPKLNVA